MQLIKKNFRGKCLPTVRIQTVNLKKNISATFFPAQIKSGDKGLTFTTLIASNKKLIEQ